MAASAQGKDKPCCTRRMAAATAAQAQVAHQNTDTPMVMTARFNQWPYSCRAFSAPRPTPKPITRHARATAKPVNVVRRNDHPPLAICQTCK